MRQKEDGGAKGTKRYKYVAEEAVGRLADDLVAGEDAADAVEDDE
jgi:hypothetical protein